MQVLHQHLVLLHSSGRLLFHVDLAHCNISVCGQAAQVRACMDGVTHVPPLASLGCAFAALQRSSPHHLQGSRQAEQIAEPEAPRQLLLNGAAQDAAPLHILPSKSQVGGCPGHPHSQWGARLSIMTCLLVELQACQLLHIPPSKQLPGRHCLGI